MYTIGMLTEHGVLYHPSFSFDPPPPSPSLANALFLLAEDRMSFETDIIKFFYYSNTFLSIQNFM